MYNKYLEKIANNAEFMEGKKPAIVEGLVGAYALKNAPSKVLGYETLYHGTTKDNAKSIRKFGFNPNHGGSNNASKNLIYEIGSKGRTHFTKSPYIANTYAGGMDRHVGDPLSMLRERIQKGAVIKVKVPHYQYMKYTPDHTAYGFGSKLSDDAAREMASKTKRTIHTKRIIGSDGYVGISNFLTKKHLQTYYGRKTGKVRGLKGLGLAAIGTGLLADSVKRLKEKK